MAHAVCVSNLAVLVAIRRRANKSMLQLQEAVEQAQFAIGLAERALEDRIRAEAASTKCCSRSTTKHLLDWDKAFAILATNEAKQDHKRQAKISLLERSRLPCKEETEGRGTASRSSRTVLEFSQVLGEHDAAALELEVRD